MSETTLHELEDTVRSQIGALHGEGESSAASIRAIMAAAGSYATRCVQAEQRKMSHDLPSPAEIPNVLFSELRGLIDGIRGDLEPARELAQRGI
jgi:hypothetical protein